MTPFCSPERASPYHRPSTQAEALSRERHAEYMRRRDLERTARMAGHDEVADAWLLEQLECEAQL